MRNHEVDHCRLIGQNLAEFLEVRQSFVLLLHVSSVVVKVVLLLAEQHFLRELVFVFLAHWLLVVYLLAVALFTYIKYINIPFLFFYFLLFKYTLRRLLLFRS